MIGPLDNTETFEVDDFLLLEKYMKARHAAVVAEQVVRWQVENRGDLASDMALRVCALVTTDPVKKRRVLVILPGSVHRCVRANVCMPYGQCHSSNGRRRTSRRT
jgi:hypothetical protein